MRLKFVFFRDKLLLNFLEKHGECVYNGGCAAYDEAWYTWHGHTFKFMVHYLGTDAKGIMYRVARIK